MVEKSKLKLEDIAISNKNTQGIIVKIISKVVLRVTLDGSLIITLLVFLKKKLILTKNQKTKTDNIIK